MKPTDINLSKLRKEKSRRKTEKREWIRRIDKEKILCLDF